MFEKEAEEYLDTESKYLIEDNEGNIINIAKKVKQSFQDGAEFGYNKANKWHYPSKGEYPKECENPTSYDFSRVGYHAGRKDGVKEVLRDLRRFAQYVVRGETCTKEDIFNLIDRKYEEIGESVYEENSN